MHPELVGRGGQDGAAEAEAGAEDGRECLSRGRGAKRNRVYMTQLLSDPETPPVFQSPPPAQIALIERPEADEAGSAGAGGGELQRGVGLREPGAEGEAELAAVVVRQVAGRGRCVFAAAPIRRGQLIEISPCLRFPRQMYEQLGLKQSPLEHYVFVERGTRDLLLALGIGSLFNHSETPNVDYRVAAPVAAGSTPPPDHDPQGRVTFRCSRDASAGEELCIYYGPDLWFEEGRAVE